MRALRSVLFLAFVLALVLAAARARATDDFSGTRATGMGDATRGFAIGDSAPMVNPSGMSLLKNFQALEGSYGYSSRLHAHTLHASMVDNTSGFGVAGALYYNFHAAEPGGGVTGRGHEVGLALSVPIVDRATLGGTVKYLNLSGDDAPGGHTGGVTFDVGTTVTLLPKLTVAVVGTNLRDLNNSNATQGIGYGVAVMPIEDLIIAADGLTRLTRDNHTGRKGTGFMVGGELTLAGKFAVRAGGGYDPTTANGYGAIGASAMSEIGAIDAAVRQDLLVHAGSPRDTVATISLRLFIPAPQPTLPPPGTL